MSAPCIEFRARLSRALTGPVDTATLSALGWHEHLLGCVDCRSLLEAEEALEALLASLPRPKLPPDLAAKVVARLARDPLDRLLELETAPDVPAGLAARVLAGARAREDAALERLLARASVEVPGALAARVLAGVNARRDAALERVLDRAGGVEVPAGLSARVLAHVHATRRRARFTLLPTGFARRAAAVLLVGAGLALAWRFSGDGEPPLVPLPGDDLLAHFDVLEHWELLEQLDPVALDTLTAFDVDDELLIELAEGR